MRLEVSKKVLLVHLPQGAAKLQAVKLFHFSKIVHFFLCIIFSYENSTTYEHFWSFEILKVWQPVTLQPLEAYGQVVTLWKPPISHCLEPGIHGVGRTLKAQNPWVEIPILLGKLTNPLVFFLQASAQNAYLFVWLLFVLLLILAYTELFWHGPKPKGAKV